MDGFCMRLSAALGASPIRTVWESRGAPLASVSVPGPVSVSVPPLHFPPKRPGFRHYTAGFKHDSQLLPLTLTQQLQQVRFSPCGNHRYQNSLGARRRLPYPVTVHSTSRSRVQSLGGMLRYSLGGVRSNA